MPIPAFEELNRRQDEAGRNAVRQPPQLGGRLAAPEGPDHHRLACALVLGVPGRRPEPCRESAAGRARRSPFGHARMARAGRVPGQPRRRVVHGLDEALAFCRELGGAPPRPRLRDRRRGGQGRRPRPPATAGRDLPGAPLGDRLQVPARGADHRAPRHRGVDRAHRARRPRSPCSSPCSSAGRPCRSPRSTTRTRSRLKDVRPGDTVMVRKAGDVIPEVVGPVLVGPTAGGAAGRGSSRPSARAVAPAGPAAGRERHVLHQPRLPRSAGAAHRPLRLPLGHGHRGARASSGFSCSSTWACCYDVADLYGFTTETFAGLEGFGAALDRQPAPAIDVSRSAPAAPRADRPRHPPPGPGRLLGPGPGTGGHRRGHVGAEKTPGRCRRCRAGHRRQCRALVRLARSTARWSSACRSAGVTLVEPGRGGPPAGSEELPTDPGRQVGGRDRHPGGPGRGKRPKRQ